MNWCCITLSPEQLEFGFLDILRAELEEIWIGRGGPAEFSVWLEIYESGTRIYLSPIAAEAAQILLYRFAGTTCAEPDTQALSFLLGYMKNVDSIGPEPT